MAGPNKLVWNKVLSNEWGKVAHNNAYGVKLTNTIDFIARLEVPAGQPVTYANFVLDYSRLKEEAYRIWITVGVDKLEYFYILDPLPCCQYSSNQSPW